MTIIPFTMFWEMPCSYSERLEMDAIPHVIDETPKTSNSVMAQHTNLAHVNLF